MAYATGLSTADTSGLDFRMYEIAPDKEAVQIKTGPIFIIGFAFATYGLTFASDKWWMAPYAFGLVSLSFAFGMQMERWLQKLAQDRAVDEVWNQYNVENGTWERVDV